MHTEQSMLRLSIIVTICIAGFGILFGLFSGSFSIAFDGIYSLVDAAMTVLTLIISQLITFHASSTITNKRLKERFSRGFWHLEPIVLGANGLLLMGVAIYALINAVVSIKNGGHELKFGFAIIYAAITVLVCLTMVYIGQKANQKIKSAMLALDIRAWIMSGGITAALLIAFCLGMIIDETSWDWMSSYIDPVVLALVCLFIIPLPISTVRQALADILLITPEDLKQHVDSVAKNIVAEEGFLSFRTYVARVGRAKQIELYFIVPTQLPAKLVEDWDKLRDEISVAIGGDDPNRWLTIVFTTDKEWAE